MSHWFFSLFCLVKSKQFYLLFCPPTECRDVLLPLMLRELSGALVTMADGPHDERKNSLELLNNILEVLSRNNVVRHSSRLYKADLISHLWIGLGGTVHLIYIQLLFFHTCCSTLLRTQPSPTATSHYNIFFCLSASPLTWVRHSNN